jgi:hypothetical protein
MNLKWPEPMPQNGRLSKEESDAAWATGIVRVMDAKMLCPQTLHITLFLDGTNNNDAEDNFRRDSKKKTHTIVARLFNAALDEKAHGSFPLDIIGVGTPRRSAHASIVKQRRPRRVGTRVSLPPRLAT